MTELLLQTLKRRLASGDITIEDFDKLAAKISLPVAPLTASGANLAGTAPSVSDTAKALAESTRPVMGTRPHLPLSDLVKLGITSMVSGFLSTYSAAHVVRATSWFPTLFGAAVSLAFAIATAFTIKTLFSEALSRKRPNRTMTIGADFAEVDGKRVTVADIKSARLDEKLIKDGTYQVYVSTASGGHVAFTTNNYFSRSYAPAVAQHIVDLGKGKPLSMKRLHELAGVVG
jgi:hypothetical protein